MIATIGSLVQGNENRSCWLASTSLYIFACTLTAMLLGLLLSAGGQVLQHVASLIHVGTALTGGELLLLGLIGGAYAWSDIGLFRMPRPHFMYAVPATWWRRWRPYGAAFAYGAALGLGLTTQIQFGAFYVLCLWCVVKGNALYGVLLMGTYGVARALTIAPASWIVYRRCTDNSLAMKRLLTSRETAKFAIAVLLILFSAHVFSSFLF